MNEADLIQTSKNTNQKGNAVQSPWSKPVDEITELLSVKPEYGLTSDEVNKRRKKYGANELRKHEPKNIWLILLDQFKSLIILLLGVASILAFLFGEKVEGASILAVILINAAIGFFTELRAIRSMEALYSLTQVNARVRRDGQVREIPAMEIVPGDVVVIESGDVISADLRVLESNKLQSDESALTGESVPVSKQIDQLPGETPLAERKNILYKGTAVTRGSGAGVVFATGMHTELGQISSLVQETKEEETPLEKRLDKLGHRLIGVTLIIAVFVAFSGIMAGKDLFLMIETGIALAVATIPEGLPIVATIALAKGMQTMAKRNALINKLSSVETLGATSIICTDKTGTLTENKMTARKYLLSIGMIDVVNDHTIKFLLNEEAIIPSEHFTLKEALEVGILCNNATFDDDKSDHASGDPLEIALLEAGRMAGMSRVELLDIYPEVREEAFDPDIKMMATFHENNDRYRLAVKGAPEAVIAVSQKISTENGVVSLEEKDKEWWLKQNDRLAEQGFRLLALATGDLEQAHDVKPYNDLTLIGLVCLADPPRHDVKPAIEQCKSAGIKIVMVTGDHQATARSIAQAVNLVEDEDMNVIQGSSLEKTIELTRDEKQEILSTAIFARVSPKQKLNLIDLHQKAGDIVAMTGDGVNDAPALKKADIGIAMGQRGTQVAREAADMVLQDDSLATIVAAVEQGRVIFGNIRRFVYYLLSCNVSEVLVVGLASMVGAPLPILPLQILFLNLVTDIFPALALGVGIGEKNVLDRPPRSPEESIMEKKHWMGVVVYGLIITVSVLCALYIALEVFRMPKVQSVTISFMTLAFAQLWHVFNMRGWRTNIFKNEITMNRYVWGALLLCVALVLSAIYIPGLSDVLQVTNPGLKGWTVALVLSAVPLFLGQFIKEFGSKNEKIVESFDI
ncbi:MAG TPA: cation-translocating P-type ATPase [Balneolales bacterium]|nr:cation-translocating P-type ATPase [Balneolales bacterium]